MEKGRKQGAENGLGAARTKSKSTSPRRVRPLKRPAVSRKNSAAVLRQCPRGCCEPRWYHGSFRPPSLCSAWLTGTEAFLMLPFKAGADCAAPPLYVIFIQ